jgi:hypothetical protein
MIRLPRHFDTHIRRAAGRLLAVLATLLPGVAMSAENPLVLDDFSAPSGLSSLETPWQGFSDRVMGGRSDLQAGFVEDGGQRSLRMRGRVRLENNGGFIQVRLPLSASGDDFDASAYRALRVEVRGSPGAYWLHVRSADTRRPWAYYRAPLTVGGEWSRIELALSDFAPVSVNRALDTTRLRSVALVAYGEAFDADIELRWIGLVR